MRGRSVQWAALLATAAILSILRAAPAPAQVGPDVIVGDLHETESYVGSGGFSAFAIGTVSCNLGDEELLWVSTSSDHPVIVENLYRLLDGRLEQVGQSWVKHGFFALSMDLCTPGGCIGTSGSTLGVGCSDPYSAELNGSQASLGPRSQVDPTSGVFPFPFTAPSFSGPTVRRIEVSDADLDPAANPGAVYYGEGQYVAADDAAAGNDLNNVSNRLLAVTPVAGSFSLDLVPGEETVREQTTVERWASEDPLVELAIVDPPAGGRIFVAHRVEEVPGVGFRYEYAVYNMNAHVAVGSFSVPLAAGISISDTGFHAVHTHGDEPWYDFGDGVATTIYTSDPWSESLGADAVSWSTPAPGLFANPLRWGTMYNFRYTSPAPPMDGLATLGLWRDGSSATALVRVPDPNYVAPVEGVACEHDLVLDEAQLSWAAGEAYDAVEVSRDGALVATLPGDATSFTEPLAAPGTHLYEIIGWVGGEPSSPVPCEIEVAIVDHAFQLRVEDGTVTYDPDSGVGYGDVSVRVVEDPDNPGYPNGIDGLSLAIAADSTLLTPLIVVQGSDLDPLDPDFFAPAILDGGITLGVVIRFDLSGGLLAQPQAEVARLSLAPGPLLLGDPDGALTTLQFADGLLGPFGVIAQVAVDATVYPPTTRRGTVTISPGVVGPIYIRGDVNDDGALDVADAVAQLGHLFTGTVLSCPRAADANADGGLDIADPIYSLSFLFVGGLPPAPPYPACGVDGAPAGLPCPGPTSCL